VRHDGEMHIFILHAGASRPGLAPNSHEHISSTTSIILKHLALKSSAVFYSDSLSRAYLDWSLDVQQFHVMIPWVKVIWTASYTDEIRHHTQEVPQGSFGWREGTTLDSYSIAEGPCFFQKKVCKGIRLLFLYPIPAQTLEHVQQ
jgi:hypothetical protein